MISTKQVKAIPTYDGAIQIVTAIPHKKSKKQAKMKIENGITYFLILLI